MSPDIAQLEDHRTALTGHCYRMLGSAVDADDAVQETMVRASRSLDRFDGRASLRTWMVRVATNVCLDALASRGRRARPLEEGPMGTFTSRSISDTSTHTEGLFALSCSSRAHVDAMVAKAIAAGGTHAQPPSDHGFMYAWSFYDLDGHHWEVLWMDEAKVDD